MWVKNGECGRVYSFSGCHPFDLILEARSLGSHTSKAVQKEWGSQSIWSDGCECSRGFKQPRAFFPCAYNEAQSPYQVPKALCNRSPLAFVSSFIFPFTDNIGASMRPYLCTVFFFSPFGSWFLPGMHFHDFPLGCDFWGILFRVVLAPSNCPLSSCSSPSELFFCQFPCKEKARSNWVFKSKAVIHALLTFHALGQKLKVWSGGFILDLPHNFSHGELS